MKLKGRVPVEQLDDERLTNIERKLVVAVSEMAPQRERSWSRRGLALAGVAMAMGVAGVVGWKLHAPAPAQTSVATGEAPYTLSTSDGTKVRVTHAGTRSDLVMGEGKLELDVKHDPKRLLVVHAGDTDIEDVGTKFSVDYDGAGHVEVRVTEGEVKVKRAGKEFEVTANNAWTTEQGTITLAQLDSETIGVGTDNTAVDVAMDTPNGNDLGTPIIDDRGSSAARGSDERGSAVGSAAGSANGKHKAGETSIKKAILAVKLEPLPGTIADYRTQLLTATGDKSRLLYSIAVRQHEAKDDDGALRTIRGSLSGRTKDEAYTDAMWLQVRITCLRALDDQCRVAAHRYITNTDSGAIHSGTNAGIADQILKAIANGP